MIWNTISFCVKSLIILNPINLLRGGYEMVCDVNKKQNRYMYKVIPLIDTSESLTFLLYSSTIQPCLVTL